MAVVTSSSTTTHVIHHLFRPRPPPPFNPAFSYLFLRPFSTVSSPTSKSKSVPLNSLKSTFKSFLYTPLSPPSFLSQCLSTASHSSPPSASLEEEEEDEEQDGDFEDSLLEDEEKDGDFEDVLLEEDDSEDEEEEGEVGLEENMKREDGPLKVKKSGVKVPTLTVKEKKELASYAHGLGKKLKSQLVGKSGVTTNLATSFLETLEANELLKIKIHRTCPGELDEVVQQLEEATGSVIVSKIGRTVIIYKPSVTKLKAEEKKQQARSRIYVRKDAQAQPTVLSRVRSPTLSKPGRQRRTRV